LKIFFRENNLNPTQQQIGEFTLWRSGKLNILCGDYFALTQAHLGKLDTVYDRAALTALPENIRQLYIAQLKRLVSNSAMIFLLTVEDAADNATAKQANGIDEEIKNLYSAEFEIELSYVKSVFEPDPESLTNIDIRAEYKVYRLTSK